MAGAPNPFARYLDEADALFEAGNVVKAGQIWQAILKRDATHAIARAGLYKVKVYFDARATQDGLTALPMPDPPPEALGTAPALEAMDKGCALYDAGRIEEAIANWEKVLAMDPGNALVRGYLDGARRKLEADAIAFGQVPQPPPAAAPEPEPDAQADNERLLRDGCTLFDMGQEGDALQKWERILATDPHHALALAYASDARKNLGLPPRAEDPAQVQSQPLPERGPAPVEPSAESPRCRCDEIVREGVQLYDLGMADEAVDKWNQVLELDPTHPEAAGYVEMARRDQASGANSAPAPAPAPASAPLPPPPPPAVPAENLREIQIQKAETLLRGQRYEEAGWAFQLLLEQDPQDPRVLHGYQQTRAILAAQTPPVPDPPKEPLRTPAPAPVGPPKALTTRATAVRLGLKLPGVAGLTLPPWLSTPRNLVLTGAGIILTLIGLLFLGNHRREMALKAAVAAAKADAMAPVSNQIQVPALEEPLPGVRQEAQAALEDDPLLAFLRAQECLRQDPADAPAAQILGQAKSRLAAAPAAGSREAFDKDVQAGDLETAKTSVWVLLGQAPDDVELRSRARSVLLALAQYYATKERFAEAKTCLLQVRALFPQDRSWQVKLRLLESIQGMVKADRPGWIQMLG